MNAIPLPGCRNDSLLGFLKALGVMRTFSIQADRWTRASWEDASLVLHTTATREDLETFFLDRYAPTPVVNPWNNGAGFDEKRDVAFDTVSKIRTFNALRWAPYRRVIDAIYERYVTTGRRSGSLTKESKDEFLRDLRQHCPEEGLAWMDAAVAVTAKKAAYPYLLGTGGNDGRLDFAVNFAARAIDVVGEIPLADSRALLVDALDDSSTARLVQGKAIGQFSPRHAGGANSASGFEAESLVNPWDYVLMIEGALMYSGALVKRSQAGLENARVAFPFSFRRGGGYASASASEESRGEVWLPIWNGRASLIALNELFRKGRADITNADGSSVRAAAYATEAAGAALTAGMNLGLSRAERVAFVQRNGLAYIATQVGRIDVTGRSDPAMAAVSSVMADWVEQARRHEKPSGTLADALRAFDARLFDYASAGEGQERQHRGQALVGSLAALDFALARVQPDWPPPLRYLDEHLIAVLDDGSSEHRLASALTSLGAGDHKKSLRLHLEHVKVTDVGKLIYDRSIQPLSQPSVENTLADIAALRARLAGEDDVSWWAGSRGASLGDVAAMLEFDGVMKKRLGLLLGAYAVIGSSRRGRSSPVMGGDAPTLPAAYAMMKVVLDHPQAADPDIISLLRAGHGDRALALSVRRSRVIRGLRGRWRDIAGIALAQPRWYAAALLVPIDQSRQQLQALLGAAMAHSSNYDVDLYREQLSNHRKGAE